MSTVFAFLHHLAALTLMSAVAIEFALIGKELTLSSARRLQVDVVQGMAAGADHAADKHVEMPMKKHDNLPL